MTIGGELTFYNTTSHALVIKCVTKEQEEAGGPRLHALFMIQIIV